MKGPQKGVVLVIWWVWLWTLCAEAATPACFILGDSLVDIGNNNFLPLSLAKANLYPNGIDYGNGRATGRFSNGRTVADIILAAARCIGGPIWSVADAGVLPDHTHTCWWAVNEVCPFTAPYHQHVWDLEKLGVPIPQPYLNPNTRGFVLLNGVNYASGAGGILDSTGRNYIQRLSFNTQLGYFQKTVAEINNLVGGSRASKLLNDALYVIVFGSNDYINNYLLRNSATSQRYSPSQFQDLLLSTFRKQLMTLCNLGARKIVVFSVGPLGCIPSQLVTSNSSGKCLDTVNGYCRGFNAAVRPMVAQLNLAFPSAKFVYGDAYRAVSQFMANPAQYGFESTNVGCCGSGPYNGQLGCLPTSNLCVNRSSYLFWDPFHPSDSTNIYLANRFLDGGLDDISPCNIRQLFLM